jgi:hypothetical protein
MASNNGTAGLLAKQGEQYAARELSLAQREHLQMLVSQMNVAHAEMEAAQQAHETATANANSFLGYCAKEHGANTQPWRFEQEQMRFVYDPAPSGLPPQGAEIDPASNGRVIEGEAHVT